VGKARRALDRNCTTFNFCNRPDCVTDFLPRARLWPDYCTTTRRARNFTSSNFATQTAAIKPPSSTCARRCQRGVRRLRLPDPRHDYPSPGVPTAPGFRLLPVGSTTRQSPGRVRLLERRRQRATPRPLRRSHNARVRKRGRPDRPCLTPGSWSRLGLQRRRPVARTSVGLSRRRACPRGRAPARSPDAIGSTRSHGGRPSNTDYYIQDRCTPTTGASSPCAVRAPGPTTEGRRERTCSIAGGGLPSRGEAERDAALRRLARAQRRSPPAIQRVLGAAERMPPQRVAPRGHDRSSSRRSARLTPWARAAAARRSSTAAERK